MELDVRAMLVSCLVLISSSCEREFSGVADGEDGEMVTVELNLDVCTPGKVSVKSWEPNTDDEKEIHDLRVYVFDGSTEDGELIGFKQVGTLETGDNGDDGYDKDGVAVTVKAGLAYIYAIANAETSQYWADNEQAILDINEFTYKSSGLTRKTFLNTVFVRQNKALTPMDDEYLMTGYANYGNLVSISEYANSRGKKTARVRDYVGKLPTALAATIRLYKVISKNTLTITTADGITFTPKHYVLKNVPTQGALIPGADADLSDCTYEEMNMVVMNSSSVSFYLPENLQSDNVASGTTFSKWSDRETNSYSGTVKSFTNAPKNATYIEVSGSYLEGSTYSGEVTYTIHLGDFGSSSEESGLDNFDVTRNYSYVYTLTINGVNNFIAEAKIENGADDPGSEGVIITPSGAHYRVDSHYEARVLKFTKSDITTQIASGMGYIMKVTTAFGETENLIVAGAGSLTKEADDGSTLTMTWPAGVYSAAKFKDTYDQLTADVNMQDVSGALLSEFKSTDGITLTGTNIELKNPENLILSGSTKTEQDWKWLHYVLNTGETTTATGGSSSIGSKVNSNHAISDVCRYPGDGKTMDIFTLLYKMYEAATTTDTSVSSAFFNTTDDDGNACAYITCFVDENYYSDRDWNTYCNLTDDRMAYIATELDVSADGKSTFANAKYVISQCSIWTVYPTTTTTIAFGTEKNSEENLQDPVVTLSYSGYSSYDHFNGHSVAVTNEKGKYWYSGSLSDTHSLINGNGSNTSTEVVQCQDFYSDAFKACMNRNRDADGDGVIDEEEIKWYLAAKDQYSLLYMGEELLPSEARLFDYSTNTWTELNNSYSNKTYENKNLNLRNWHYFTSSKLNIFWAEEGASFNERTGTIDGTGLYMASKVRCVRTLENDGNGLKDADIPIVDDGNNIIEININEDALRTYQRSAFPASAERGDGTRNHLYKKIEYASSNLTRTFSPTASDSALVCLNTFMGKETDSGDFDYVDASDDICNKTLGGAWRVPCQKELLALAVALDLSKLTPQKTTYEILWSSTYFTGLLSGYYKYDVSYYYMVNTDTGITHNTAYGLVATPASESFGIEIRKDAVGYVRCVRDVQ